VGQSADQTQAAAVVERERLAVDHACDGAHVAARKRTWWRLGHGRAGQNAERDG
jgi:hypothetical protein